MEWRSEPVASEPPLLKVEPELVEVHDALITPLSRGPLYTERGPFRWVRGAVYRADGTLVLSSQRHWNGDTQDLIAANPPEVRIPAGAEHLRGAWLYAGHWSTHFGHFLVETLPNLWPELPSSPALAGVLFHRPVRGPISNTSRPPRAPAHMQHWQNDLVTLAGHSPAGISIVHGRPLRVERLLVPKRPVLLKHWASPRAVELWQRVSSAVHARGRHSRVYLSRERFHAAATRHGRVRTDPSWEEFLDETLARAGFHVAHPEELSIPAQIELVRGVDVLAGLSGSAMHLSVFAKPGTHVLTIGDNRAPAEPTRAQAVIDAATGHRTAFVANHDRAALRQALTTLPTGPGE